jgi:uncharacterized SAM-binding protein YcdF (DUF218 family)
MYFFWKTFFRELLLPPASPLILSIAGLLMIWRHRRAGWWLLDAGLISLWLFSTPLVADQLLRWTEHYPPLDLSRPTNAQAVVILGGGGERELAPEYAGPAAEQGLLERLSYGAFVARRTGLPLLVTGAPIEALTMRTVLDRDFGIEPRWVDNQSADTYENAHFSARMLRAAGIHRIILVTSVSHIWRASHEFAGVGLDVVPAPEGFIVDRRLDALRFVPTAEALGRSSAAVYEMLGEPVRRAFEALRLREHFDTRAAL